MSGWNTEYRDPRLIPDRIVNLMPAAERARIGRSCKTPVERQAKADGRRERQLHERIEALLRVRGVTYCHGRMDRRSSVTVGWPDFTFAVKSRAVALELKMPGQEPTAEQVRVMRGLIRDGWFVRVIRSESEFVAALAELDSKCGPVPKQI